MKGKPWTVEEERLLREMLKEGKTARAIAKVLGKTRESVRIKIARLGLEVVVPPTPLPRTTTTNLQLPKELPSIETQLKKLAAAIDLLETPGLDQSEVFRLSTIISSLKSYREMFERFVDLKGFEAEVLEVKRILAEDKIRKG
jgi:hypothetical protein